MKFIHLADVHLGAVPDRGYPWSRQREEEIWETFRRVIAGIRENPVDFLFIAGDLFHRQPLLRELKEVNYLFSTIPETQVYLVAGNHDHIKPGGFYGKFSWSSNVVFFREEQVTCVRAKEHPVYVYGLSYHHQVLSKPLYDNAVPGKEEGVHILLAHGGDEQHIPVNWKRLVGAGFDYVALGHIHKPQILLKNKILYAGALEPIDRGDVGVHGYVAGEIMDGKVTVRFVPFASRSYHHITVTLREESTQTSIEEGVKAEIRRLGADNLYCITLEGVRAPELLLIAERLKNLGNVLEVEDMSRPAYDLEELGRRYSGTLIGDYIQSFRETDMGEVERKALYYGLQALLETGR